MVQTSSQSTVNKIEMRLRGKGRGSIVFQQDYADCGTPSAVKSTFHRMYTDGMLVRLAHGIYYYPKEDKEYGLGIIYPSVEDIAQAIAKRDKAKIVPMGAYRIVYADAHECCVPNQRCATSDKDRKRTRHPIQAFFFGQELCL